MEGGEAERGNGDHDAVQDDEIGLVLHNRIAPSLGHLRDTEDASAEDGKVGKDESADEDSELAVVEEFRGGRIQL